MIKKKLMGLVKIYLSLVALLIVVSVGMPHTSWFFNGAPAFLLRMGMRMGIVGTLVLTVIFVWIGIAVFVYHDARQRGMEPLLWALVAALVPYLLGLVAYLVFRQPIQGTCPSCNQAFAVTDVFCRHCGHIVQTQCGSCGRPTVRGARFCPSCGASLEGAATSQ